jgi:hypothetical protein
MSTIQNKGYSFSFRNSQVQISELEDQNKNLEFEKSMIVSQLNSVFEEVKILTSALEE